MRFPIVSHFAAFCWQFMEGFGHENEVIFEETWIKGANYFAMTFNEAEFRPTTREKYNYISVINLVPSKSYA